MPTRSDYLQEIADTVGYETDKTGALCQRFIAAARALIMFTPAKSSTAQGGVTRFDSEYDVKTLKAMLDAAILCLNQLSTTNPNVLIQTAQVGRQFGFEKIRRQSGVPNDGSYPPDVGGYN